MMRPRAGERYRPSNVTEGSSFFELFCFQCARENTIRKGDDGDPCEIRCRTMLFQVGDEMYPAEWQYGKDGQPGCTAFIPVGENVPDPRCKFTLELF